MKTKTLLLIYFFLGLYFESRGQNNLKGLWNGYITTDGHDARAGYILNIEEHQKGIISGKALLYKPNLYAHAYGLQQFFGTISNNKLVFNDIQVLDERMPSSSFHLCFKLCDLNYNNPEDTESLYGSWNSNTLNCLPGQIYLTRYDENKPDGTVPPYVLRTIKGKGGDPLFKNTVLTSPIILDVKHSSLEMDLRDYLKIDNDTVSIYLNRKLILDRHNVTKRPFRFNIRLNRNLAVNELILYANNLGTVPPNTSLLTISDGEKKHKLLIESTLQKSVAIYLNYK